MVTILQGNNKNANFTNTIRFSIILWIINCTYFMFATLIVGSGGCREYVVESNLIMTKNDEIQYNNEGAVKFLIIMQ